MPDTYNKGGSHKFCGVCPTCKAIREVNHPELQVNSESVHKPCPYGMGEDCPKCTPTEQFKEDINSLLLSIEEEIKGKIIEIEAWKIDTYFNKGLQVALEVIRKHKVE